MRRFGPLCPAPRGAENSPAQNAILAHPGTDEKPFFEICDIFPNWTKKHGPEGSGPCFLPVCRAYSLRMPALRSAGRTAFASSTDTTTASTALMRDVTPFVTSCVCTAPRACPSM